jgi:uncharacterized membrane protein
MFTFKNSIFVLTLFSTLGCALMAGVFFAFSGFVMKGLERIPANEGIAAMQSINQVVPGSIFGAAFVITPVICLAAMITAISKWDEANSVYILAGGILYLITSLVVTLVFNIPLNDSLAAISANQPEGQAFWINYQNSWNWWNHVRTLGSLGSTVMFIFALVH